MRIKVGNTWYDCEQGQPIMVELAPQDKINISNMPADATKYALFNDVDAWTVEQKLAWMDRK